MLVLPLTRPGAEKEARNADRRPYGEYEYGSRSVVDLERDTCIYNIVLVRSLIPISVSSPAVEQNEMGL